MSDQNIEEVRKSVILALIPTAAYTSLQPSAKNQVLATADMLTNYVINGLPVEKPAPTKDKRPRVPKK